jgi:hypothetical protein
MKNKNSVINYYDNPYRTFCKLIVQECDCQTTNVKNTRSATVADLYEAAKVNNCIIITQEEYKSLIDFRDSYLEEHQKLIDKD